VEFERDEVREVERNLETLRRYDRASLTPEQRDSRDVLEWFLQLQAERKPFLFNDYPVNQLNGIQNGLPDFMVNVHQINDERDAESYRVRLGRFGVALDQVIEGLEYRRQRGVVPPRFVVDDVRDDLARFVEPPPEAHFLHRHAERSLAGLDGVPEARRRMLLDGVRAALEEVVYPAYRRLDAELAVLQDVATDDAGVWRLPDGTGYYAWLLRLHTSTDLSADEIHRLGLAEVERIHAEMRAILEREGVPAADLVAALGAVSADPRFHYPDSDEGQKAILRDYQAIVDDVQVRLPELFGYIPKAAVRVERVPEFMERGVPLAYYNAPPFDGSRPGVFYANLRSVEENLKFRMRTLAYHEAIPGHHLQTAIAMEMEDAPFFRRILPFTAFTEGWALYAERLAGEQGFHPTPADRLGMLMDEVFRAVRLVVDTGIHARRWTREQAIDYMARNTGKPHSEVVAEIERYIVMPGQACAYKIGQLEILEYRERAKRQLGADFDLREFHDVVLGGGALPLELLERRVDEWVAAERGA
jgi:uncharacterized protein (DUF885 family)